MYVGSQGVLRELGRLGVGSEAKSIVSAHAINARSYKSLSTYAFGFDINKAL